jgi:ATP-binding cassette, subfamily B, bacterial MsbA
MSPKSKSSDGDIKSVNNFLRVLPHVWPYRRKVFLSMFFALVVALFWALNISMTFLIVKVFLEGQSIENYVHSEITRLESAVENQSGKVKRTQGKLASLEQKSYPKDSTEYVKLVKERSRYQSKLDTASKRLHWMMSVRLHVVPWVPSDRFDTLVCIFLFLVLVTIGKGLCTYSQDVLVGSVVELTTMSIRKECFRKCLALDFQSLKQKGTADIMSRFTNDILLLGNGLRLLGGKVVREPLKAIACISMAFYVSWQLTLLSMVFAPIVGLFFYRIGKNLKQASKRVMESMSLIYKTLEETFDSFKVVTAFNGGRKQRVRFHNENKAYFQKALKIVRIDALTSPTTEILGIFATFVGLLPGAYLVLRETTTIWGVTLSSTPLHIADLSLLYAALAGIIDPARKLSTTYAKIKRATAAADRVYEIIDVQTLVKEPQSPKKMPRLSRNIEFANISFKYASFNESDALRPPALKNIDLKIESNEVIAVVGENGSGKSTLVNLLPRFYDPSEGTVHIDGVELREAKLEDLRSQIGVVTQETLLFDQSIRENIGYGKPGATEEEILSASIQAHVTQFVEELPDGFETSVGDKGQKLSGGQRQRIALARAILRNPSILILDEATSAIDILSEKLIHEALKKFVKGRTTFIITHSIDQGLLDIISRIVVMEQGEVIATGTHEELVQSCFLYQRLFSHQNETGTIPINDPSQSGEDDNKRDTKTAG